MIRQGTCPDCGHPPVPGAKFCSECGARLAGQVARETRRTVTAVFADVVGSTPLQERIDAEAAHHVMERFYVTMRAALESHGGHVAKFIGDAVVALFGFPIVREDDALRAVRAACAMRDALAPLNEELARDWGVRIGMRTGVNTGEVVISPEGLAVGDTMNVAARLEQSAPDGEVLVGEPTWRHVRHTVRFEPVEPLNLKGKRDPVPAYRLLEVPEGADHRVRIDAPLVGRDDELARLVDAFEGAVRARCCRFVSVIGSPGIGKTRLSEELAQTLADRAAVVNGRCEPAGEGITFLPVMEVLRGAASIGEADGADTVRSKLAALVPDDPDRELLVERAAGILGVAPAASTQETFWSVRRLLGGLARTQPLLVVLDDVHWGEPTFLDLVEHLAEWGRESPILLLGLSRPELRELRPALAEIGLITHDVVELSPLGEESSRRLIDELLDRADVPEPLARRVLRTTEGNPLFLGETLRMLVDDGVLRREGGGWVTGGDAGVVEVPPTISALLAARIDRLGAEERSVVERAAVIGKQFYRGAVAELAPAPVAAGLDGHLEALHRKEVVAPDGTVWVDEPVFRFHHVLIRDAAYRALLKEARADLHERFADWLERKVGALVGEHEEVLAFHLEQAHGYRRQLGPLDDRGRALSERAVTRLHSAGRRALAREDLPAAANLLRRAADTAGPAVDGELLVDLLEALLSAGDTGDAATAMTTLREVHGDDPRLSAWATVVGAQLAQLTDSGRLHETLGEVSAAADVLAAVGDDRGLAKAHHVRAQGLAQLGRVGDVEYALDQALAAARRVGDTRRVTAVLSGAPRAALWGPSPVMRASGRCLDVVRILRMNQGNRHVEAVALRCQAVLEAMRGRADAARQILDRCRATLQELGLGMELLETEQYAGIVELIAGQEVAAEHRLRAAYDGFSHRRLEVGAASAAALLARALLGQGRDDEADELTRVSEAHAGEDLKTTIAWCGVRAQVLARRGEHAEAEKFAQRAVQVAAGTDALVDHGDARMALGEVLRAAGRPAEAMTEAARAAELYELKGHEVGVARAKAFAGPEPTMVSAARDATTRAPRPPETSAVAMLAAGLSSAFDRRDFAAFRARITEDVVILDCRRASPRGDTHGAQELLEHVQAYAELASDATFQLTPLVDAGDLGITRVTFAGHETETGSAYEISFLSVIRVVAGRLAWAEQVDLDDAHAAVDRLLELAPNPETRSVWRRHCEVLLAVTEGPVTPRQAGQSAVAILGAALSSTFDRRDWTAFRSHTAEDIVVLDRRRASPRGNTHSAQQLLDHIQAYVALASDVTFRLVPLVDLGDAGIMRATFLGHEDESGSGFEISFLSVVRLVHGKLTRADHLDLDDAAAAVDRLLELAPDRGTRAEWRRRCDVLLTAPETHPHGAVGRLVRQLCGAQDRRDWTAAALCVTDDLVVLDRRRASPRGDSYGAEAFLHLIRAYPESARDVLFDNRQLIDSDELGIAQVLVHGHQTDTGSEFSIPLLILTRVVDGRFDLMEFFDPEAGHAAVDRLLELMADPGRRAVWRPPLNVLLAVHDGDAAALDAAFASDVEVVDHRADAVRSRVALLDVLRSGERPGLRLLDMAAGAALLSFDDGSPALGMVSEAHGGRTIRIELFDPADDAGMRRCTVVADTGRSAGARVRAAMVAAVNRRDWTAVASMVHDDLVFVDRRAVGTVGDLAGRVAWVDRLRAWSAVTPDLHGTIEEQIESGDLALGVFVWRGHASDGGGPFELPLLLLSGLRGERLDRLETFDVGAESVATARLAELRGRPNDFGVVAEGPVDVERTARERLHSFADRVNVRDIPGMLEAYGDDIRLIDHRLVSPMGGELNREDHFARTKALFAESADVRLRVEDVGELAGAWLGRLSWVGHQDETGAEFEIPMRAVAWADNGFQMEVFGVDDEPRALRTFCRLAGLPAEADPRAELSVCATEAIDRRGEPATVVVRDIAQALGDRAWDRLRDRFAVDLETIDHRTVATLGFDLPGGQGFVDRSQALFAVSGDATPTVEPLAEIDGVALVTISWSGSLDDGGGAFEVRWRGVVVVRNGFVVRYELFDEDDEAGMVSAALAARDVAADRPASPFAELYTRYYDAFNARDWATMRAALADDFVVVDRRPATGWSVLRGAEAAIGFQRNLLRMSPDLRVVTELVEADDECVIARYTHRGHETDADGGGQLEETLLHVQVLRAGRGCHLEIHRPDADIDTLRARREELRPLARRQPGIDLPAEPLESEHVVVRVLAALDAGDWITAGGLLAVDVCVVDHRSVSTYGDEVRDRGSFLTRFAAINDSVLELTRRLEIITADESGAAGVFTARGLLADGGGAFELPACALVTVRDGRVAALEIFETDDEVGLLARFDELRPLAHRRPGADLPPEPLAIEHAVLRLCELMNADDWTTARETLQPTFAVVDHRAVSTYGDEIDREAFIAIQRALNDNAVDAIRRYMVLTATEAVSAGILSARGRLADGGGPFELAVGIVCVWSDGRWSRMEFFDADDEPGLLERFAALNPCLRPGTGMPTEPLEAERLALRLCAATNASDWATVAAMVDPGFEVVDHRPASTYGEDVRDRDAMIARQRALNQNGSSVVRHYEVVAAVETATAGVMSTTGRLIDGDGPFEMVFGTIFDWRDDRCVRMEIFDHDDEAGMLARFGGLNSRPGNPMPPDGGVSPVEP